MYSSTTVKPPFLVVIGQVFPQGNGTDWESMVYFIREELTLSLSKIKAVLLYLTKWRAKQQLHRLAHDDAGNTSWLAYPLHFQSLGLWWITCYLPPHTDNNSLNKTGLIYHPLHLLSQFLKWQSRKSVSRVGRREWAFLSYCLEAIKLRFKRVSYGAERSWHSARYTSMRTQRAFTRTRTHMLVLLLMWKLGMAAQW